MTERKEFFCHQAADKGFLTITEEYCLEKCDSAQRGVKTECPLSVKSQPPKEDEKGTTEEQRP